MELLGPPMEFKPYSIPGYTVSSALLAMQACIHSWPEGLPEMEVDQDSGVRFGPQYCSKCKAVRFIYEGEPEKEENHGPNS